MDHLTERRKTDRAKIAEAVRALAVELGCTAEIDAAPFGGMSPRMVMVRIRTDRGLQLHVDLDGDSIQPDVHVLSWHMASDVDTRLADAFGDINPFHHSKATDVARGTAALLATIRRRLEQCADGSAYSAEREAAAIAKHGSAAARSAAIKAQIAEQAASRDRLS